MSIFKTSELGEAEATDCLILLNNQVSPRDPKIGFELASVTVLFLFFRSLMIERYARGIEVLLRFFLYRLELRAKNVAERGDAKESHTKCGFAYPQYLTF